jgi:predicted lipid-binding transport protein (Tim44 family)
MRKETRQAAQAACFFGPLRIILSLRRIVPPLWERDMKRSPSSFARRAATAVALVAAVSFSAGDAFARAGKGGSSGSRGSMTRSAPPTTDTAPRTAQPLPGAQNPSAAVRNGTAGAAQAAQPSRMRSMMTGLAMGFLGAGLFGLFTGQGFFGGMGSLLGLLGLILQIGLVFFLVRWAINAFRRRPAEAGAAPNFQRQPMPQGMPGAAGMGAGMGMGMGAASAAPAAIQPLQMQERDFNAFERLLTEVQEAYGRGDRSALHVRATPEMAGNFARELDENDRNGVTNKLSGVKLLQGDLAEAWREPGAEYATVAMRYAIVDALVDKTTGRLVEGDAARPQEVTELWTFVRRPGETSEGWKLSAIQQA